MSPYLGASDLSLQLPAGVSIGTNTDPLTIGEIGSIIAEVSGEVEGYLSAAGYPVPIVSTVASVAFAQVQRIVRQGAAWSVLGVIFPNMGGPSDKTSLASDYRDAYRAALKMIQDGKFALIGVAADSGETGRALPRSFTTSNPGADAAALAASPLVPMLWEP